jgi:hypothetical protein
MSTRRKGWTGILLFDRSIGGRTRPWQRERESSHLACQAFVDPGATTNDGFSSLLPHGRFNRMIRVCLASPLLLLALAGSAAARPTAPRVVCGADADVVACHGSIPSCTLCHAGAPLLNRYGAAVARGLAADPQYNFDNFDDRLPGALDAIADDDADGDGLSNLEELLLGTLPGDAQSHHVAPPPPSGRPNTHYAVGERDAVFAHRRVLTSFCGRPPTFDEQSAFRAANAGAREQLLHDALSTCLSSPYWRDEALHRLADAKIRPLEAIGFDGLIPLADYGWDYRLFSHVMSGDRDVRDLLLATYHIDEDGSVVDGVIPAPPDSPLETGGQPLAPEQRAGMLTTQWFLMIHTMFSALPRTTAAQAYRAYLGMDIARSEGIDPVEGEPRDVDSRGVTEPACAVCHSTLDPLSYAFSPYNGIGRLSSRGVRDIEKTGAYDDARVPWPDDSVLFGASVPSLRAWAERAAATDAFFATVTRTLWTGAFGRPPHVGENVEFEALWRDLAADAAAGGTPRAERVLHDLIDTDAFRVP